MSLHVADQKTIRMDFLERAYKNVLERWQDQQVTLKVKTLEFKELGPEQAISDKGKVLQKTLADIKAGGKSDLVILQVIREEMFKVDPSVVIGDLPTGME